MPLQRYSVPFCGPLCCRFTCIAPESNPIPLPVWSRPTSKPCRKNSQMNRNPDVGPVAIQPVLEDCPFCSVKPEPICKQITLRFLLLHRCKVLGPVTLEGSSAQAVADIWNTRAGAWQDISTVPKDGSLFDCWVIHPDHDPYRAINCRWGQNTVWADRPLELIRWQDGRWQPVNWLVGYDRNNPDLPLQRATHWRRPPAPPKDAANEPS